MNADERYATQLRECARDLRRLEEEYQCQRISQQGYLQQRAYLLQEQKILQELVDGPAERDCA